MHLLTVDEELLSYRFVIVLPKSLDVVADVAESLLARETTGYAHQRLT